MHLRFSITTFIASISIACLTIGIARADNLEAKIEAFQQMTETRMQQEIYSLCSERFGFSVHMRNRCIDDQNSSRAAAESIRMNRIQLQRSSDPSDKKTAVVLKQYDKACTDQSYDQHVRTDWTAYYNCMQGKLSFYAPR